MSAEGAEDMLVEKNKKGYYDNGPGEIHREKAVP